MKRIAATILAAMLLTVGTAFAHGDFDHVRGTVAATGYLMIRRGFSARDQPSSVETFIARRARAMAVPARARDAANPVPLSADALAEARAHFADHCATCHANDGSGKTTIGQNLY